MGPVTRELGYEKGCISFKDNSFSWATRMQKFWPACMSVCLDSATRPKLRLAPNKMLIQPVIYKHLLYLVATSVLVKIVEQKQKPMQIRGKTSVHKRCLQCSLIKDTWLFNSCKRKKKHTAANRGCIARDTGPTGGIPRSSTVMKAVDGAWSGRQDAEAMV